MNRDDKRTGYTRARFRAEAKPDEKKLFLRGYAILFNEPTEIYDRRNGLYTEVITREALDNADLSDVYLLKGHNYDYVLGHTRANLRLEVDDVGLFYECELPNTRDARDVFNLVESNIVDGNSFGFFTNDEVVDGVRVVRNLMLDEISIVPRPAYLNACSVATTQDNADVEHQPSETENAEEEVEHQQEEEALKVEAQALIEKLKKLEEL